MDEPFNARQPDHHHPHPGRVVAVLAVAGLGSSFVFTAIIPIQAHLPDLFASGREQTAWAVTATLLVAAVLTPISGRLADMIGKRRVALALLALLALGSVVSAGAQELWMLVLGRGLQGADPSWQRERTPLGCRVLEGGARGGQTGETVSHHDQVPRTLQFIDDPH
ncbi:MFS transporter [Nocardia fusca]|uniref:MFS transporter n=1 Tax=Nocardia fusca TaxID=941183 RepID=UPI0037B1218E